MSFKCVYAATECTGCMTCIDVDDCVPFDDVIFDESEFEEEEPEEW